MASRSDKSPDYIRGLRRVLIGALASLLVLIFLVWRIDNARVEQLRVSLVDHFVPSFAWTVRPIAATARMLGDLGSYQRVYQQNTELRRELQRMQGWREAALQLEQKNASLLALNKVRLSPRLTFVTGEVMADSGSPFLRSAMSMSAGPMASPTARPRSTASASSAALPGSASVPPGSSCSPTAPAACPRWSGPRVDAMVIGDNGPAPALDFVDQANQLRPGDRVVSSGDGGLYPPDILIGQIIVGPDGRQRVRLAADYRKLDFVRVVRTPPASR